MKILLNGTTLVMGGALQVAYSLIVELAGNSHGHTIKNVVSRELANLLPDDIDITVVTPSPAKPVSGQRSRRQLAAIENNFSPDIVLTIFGPAYWKPKAIHICGFADSWVFTSNRYPWQLLSLSRKGIVKLRCIYKRLALKHQNTAAFIVETDALSGEIHNTWPSTRIFIIPNNCGQAFYEYKLNANGHNPVMPEKNEDEFRIVTLSQYYEHKNLEIIPRVARILKDRKPSMCFKFFLSLDMVSSAWQKIYRSAQNLGVGESMCTVGVVQPQMAPFFYEGADAMFLPSVLECFSANYPEAMKMAIPVVTTDLPFAHTVCKDAALYFEPLNAQSAADKLIDLYNDESLKKELIEQGKTTIKDFPTPREKGRKYIEICETLFTK
jgi:glycosyltransferase involved in cell wall biosynthesis